MTFAVLLADISYRLWGKSDFLEREVTDVTADVSRACADALFVCTRTPLRDGHRQVSAAYTAGCRVFVVDSYVELPDDAAILVVPDAEALLGELAARFWGYPARALTVLGVSGTAGKTWVCDAVTAMLRRAKYKVAALTTDGLHVGFSLRPSGNVVPDAAEIQALLRRLLDEGITHVVLELSAYMLSHKAAFSIPFAAVLLTNLGKAHVGYGEFATQEAYVQAKLSLLEHETAVALLPTGAEAIAPSCKCLRFGREEGDFCARDVEPFTDALGFGVRFSLVLPDGQKYAVSLPVPGDIAVENALAAAAMATAVGVPPAAVAKGLSRFMPRGRMECVGVRNRRHVFVDSAFEADGLTRALRVLRSYTQGRLTVLLGSVGGRALWRRAALGKAATAGADYVYFTADDPNTEDPIEICNDMVRDLERTNYCVIGDRRHAVERAVLEMRPGDTLLLAGKGAAGYQLIGGEKLPFDEREIVARAMALL